MIDDGPVVECWIIPEGQGSSLGRTEDEGLLYSNLTVLYDCSCVRESLSLSPHVIVTIKDKVCDAMQSLRW